MDTFLVEQTLGEPERIVLFLFCFLLNWLCVGFSNNLIMVMMCVCVFFFFFFLG